MVSQPGIRKRRARRKLPAGPRLAFLLTVAAACCAVTLWFFQPRPNSAKPLIVQSSMATIPLDKSNVVVNAPANVRTTAPNCAAVSNVNAPIPVFKLTQELPDLTQQLKQTCDKPNLHAGIFVVEPESGRYVDIDARRPYSSASMIKLPVLVALCQALDARQVSLDQELTIRDDLIGGGSGWLQWRKPGTKLSLKQTAELMIIISDNTATNMIIDLLGGKDNVNATFARWGLTATKINNPLPDLPGTNTTSPYDLAYLMGAIDSGRLVSSAQRAWILDTLGRNKIRTLLPMGIPPGTKIADKTGDIATLVGDVGLITSQNGHHYIASVCVERPWNDRRANALIREVSKEVYAGLTGDQSGIQQLNKEQSTQAMRAPRGRGRAGRSRHGRRRHG